VGDTERTRLRLDHHVVRRQFEELPQVVLVAHQFGIQVPGTEGDRIHRLVVLHRAREKMPDGRHEFRHGAGTGGAGDIDMLVDQPAGETHPHGKVTEHAVLHPGRIIAAEVDQCGFLAFPVDHQPIVDRGIVAHPADLVELDAPMQRSRQGGAVDHTEGDQPGGAHGRLRVGHEPAGFIAECLDEFEAQAGVLLAGDKGCLDILSQRIKGEPGGA